MPEITPIKNKEQNLRMSPEHIFLFNCNPDIPCFTKCCRDVTIVLTPYDVLCLKRDLEISSDEFLDKYTIIIPKEKRLIPLVIIKMNEDDKKCPFVSEKGCSVYNNRPWPCRMYPLDMNDDGTLCYISDPGHCLGLKEKDQWRIGDWLIDQGIVPYDEMNTLFSEVTSPLQAQEIEIQNPDISRMIFMALYNLDKFKSFVFESTFLDRFEVDPIKVEKIKRDETELLKFGFDWIKFGIFGQILFRVKEK